MEVSEEPLRQMLVLTFQYQESLLLRIMLRGVDLFTLLTMSVGRSHIVRLLTTRLKLKAEPSP